MIIFFRYDSKIWAAALIFYICIYHPFLQAKRSFLDFIGLFFGLFHRPLEYSNADRYESSKQLTSCCSSTELPRERYGELKKRSFICCDGHDDDDGDDEEACSVCLAEFECEDYVSKLCRCGHVFHMNCIQQWVGMNQFTCPLCRCFFLCL